jgi:hypothetical protein
MTDTKYMGFDALTPFFDLITQALTGMADGKHFFDIFNGTIVFEYPYAIPGTLPRTDGLAR